MHDPQLVARGDRAVISPDAIVCEGVQLKKDARFVLELQPIVRATRWGSDPFFLRLGIESASDPNQFHCFQLEKRAPSTVLPAGMISIEFLMDAVAAHGGLMDAAVNDALSILYARSARLRVSRRSGGSVEFELCIDRIGYAAKTNVKLSRLMDWIQVE